MNTTEFESVQAAAERKRRHSRVISHSRMGIKSLCGSSIPLPALRFQSTVQSSSSVRQKQLPASHFFAEWPPSLTLVRTL